jgi:hypothetical protein
MEFDGFPPTSTLFIAYERFCAMIRGSMIPDPDKA